MGAGLSTCTSSPNTEPAYTPVCCACETAVGYEVPKHRCLNTTGILPPGAHEIADAPSASMIIATNDIQGLHLCTISCEGILGLSVGGDSCG